MTLNLRTPLARLLSVAALGAAVLSAPTPAQAVTVYANSGPSTYAVLFNSAQQLGDVITLGGTDRVLTGVTVRFFSVGSGGSFDAQISFYDYAAGQPINSLLGSFSVLGNSIGGIGSTLDVTFGPLNLPVPNQLAFAVSVSNLGGDLGLRAVDPPSVGSSLNTMNLRDTGSGLEEISAPSSFGNLFFVANATAAPIPEPSAALMAALGLLVLAGTTRRRRRVSSPQQTHSRPGCPAAET